MPRAFLPSAPKKEYIKAFVSHRCNEYDEVKWKPFFEGFLKSYNIVPEYGCFIGTSYSGSLKSNIENAINRSDIYIAVITKSWKDGGWPPQELNLWHQLKGNTPAASYKFGFNIDVARKAVQFINDIPSPRLWNKKAGRYTRLLFGDGITSFYIDKKGFDYIDKYIKSISSEILK